MPTTYQAEYPPVIVANHQEQEAVNLVLTGTALAAHATGNEVLIYGVAAPAAPVLPAEPPSETGVLNMAMNDSTDDIVALQDKATTVAVGDYIKIDSEYMTATDTTDLNNLKVARASLGSAIVAHAVGAGVSVYGTPPPPEPPPSGNPTETGEVQWLVAVTDTDIALVSTPSTVVVGSTFLIDAEYMIVSGISNPDNPNVTRGAYGSVVAAHAAGAAVTIWGQVMKSAQARPPKAAESKAKKK